MVCCDLVYRLCLAKAAGCVIAQVVCCDLVYRLCLAKAAGCVIALIVCCVPGVLVVAGAPVIVSRALCQVCVCK